MFVRKGAGSLSGIGVVSMVKHIGLKSLCKTVSGYVCLWVFGIVVLMNPFVVHAQFGGGLLAPTDALDTLSGGSVPSGGSFGTDDFGTDDFGSGDFGSDDGGFGGGFGDGGFGEQAEAGAICSPCSWC